MPINLYQKVATSKVDVLMYINARAHTSRFSRRFSHELTKKIITPRYFCCKVFLKATFESNHASRAGSSLFRLLFYCTLCARRILRDTWDDLVTPVKASRWNELRALSQKCKSGKRRLPFLAITSLAAG